MTALPATFLSGPKELRGTAGTLDFDAVSVSYVITAIEKRFDWPWETSSVTFDAEITRRADRNLLAGVPLLGLIFRRKSFKIQVSPAEGPPIVFWVYGDSLLRDSVARQVVAKYPTSVGRVAVGAQAVT